MKIEDAEVGRSTITPKNFLTQRAWAREADGSESKKNLSSSPQTTIFIPMMKDTKRWQIQLT
jgi:hypothetical protein